MLAPYKPCLIQLWKDRRGSRAQQLEPKWLRVNVLGLRAVSDLPDEFDRSQSAYKRKCKTVLLHQQTEIPPTTTTQVLLSDGDERQTKIGSWCSRVATAQNNMSTIGRPPLLYGISESLSGIWSACLKRHRPGWLSVLRSMLHYHCRCTRENDLAVWISEEGSVAVQVACSKGSVDPRGAGLSMT